LNPGILGGEGIANASSTITASYGGGSISIRAQGGITMSGTISAPGDVGSPSLGGAFGGSGGGIVILASKANISYSGTINVAGGNASPGTSGNLAGPGGGGGGVIHFLSPNASAITCTSSTCNVNGGTAAAGFGSPTPTTNGSPGGASGGNGGNGTLGAITAGTAGSAGVVFKTQVTDPATLFN
jgi:hypothetical protein